MLNMASLFTSFNSSKLKLAHVNIRSCRNKEVKISLFPKENDINIDIDVHIYLVVTDISQGGGRQIFGKMHSSKMIKN